MRRISELYSCSVSMKGVYVMPGRKPGPGERPLYLLIEGPTDVAITQAKVSATPLPPPLTRLLLRFAFSPLLQSELRRILEEETLKVGFDKAQFGKYQVI